MIIWIIVFDTQKLRGVLTGQGGVARILFDCMMLCEVGGKKKNVDFVSTFQ